MTSVSFCIATSGTYNGLQEVLDSIEALNIPEYEVFVTGGETPNFRVTDRIQHIPFDENRVAHIQVYGHPGREVSRKKNLGCRMAKNDVLVIMNDYVKFLPDFTPCVFATGLIPGPALSQHVYSALQGPRYPIFTLLKTKNPRSFIS